MLIFASCVSLSSCSNDVEDNDDGPKSVDFTQKVSLYVGESSSLPNREDSCVWVSDKPLVANVENRTIVANKVGFTIIKAHKSACEVTVKPRYTMFEEPCLEWGLTLSSVKDYMSGYSIDEASNTATMLCYKGEGDVLAYYYTFYANLLEASSMVIELDDLTLENVGKFIDERYYFVTYSEEADTYYYVCPEAKVFVGVGVSEETSAIIITYIPYANSRSTSYEQLIYKTNRLFEQCKPTIQ